MKGAQVAGTEVGMNWKGYIAHYAPAPTLYVQKTIDAVKKYSKQRLGRMIEACPVLRYRFKEDKSKDAQDSILIKNFPGGILIMGGANSAASLRSMPIANLILDEVDSYESDIDDEGDPVELAIRRTANFSRRKIYKVSTPTIKETSRIEPAFQDGDQRYYYVPCPHCGQKQTITWDKIKWDNQDPTTARMICETCEKDIPERFKTWMLENGEWMAMNPDRPVASFHLSSLYSPLGWYSWKDAVKLFIKASRTHDAALWKTFYNTVLGETWSEAGKTIDYSSIQGRALKNGAYKAEIPKEVLVLTAGVDVQADRIEVEIVGWGKNQRSYGIQYARFYGDPEMPAGASPQLPPVWGTLLQFLLHPRKREDGAYLRVSCAGIDSGFSSKTVYNVAKFYQSINFFAIKGDEGWGKGSIKRPTRPNQEGVMLFTFYVDTIKSKIYSLLGQQNPDEPGYCHFPPNNGYDEDYYRGLTSEKLVKRRYKGHDKLTWELPPGMRNEPLDCRCYATGALYIISPNFDFIESLGGMGIVTLPSPGSAPVAQSGARILHRGEEA